MMTDTEKHNHPSREVIAKILKVNEKKKTLYFNYPVDIVNDIGKDKLKEKYNYSLVVGNRDSSLQIEVSDR